MNARDADAPAASPGRMMMILRRLARHVRHGPDRLAHPFRRSAVRRHLSARVPVDSILFVCLGNICRSPYAAAVAARLLERDPPLRVKVSSAGFIGPGRPAPPNAVAVAAERAIDLTIHRSQIVDDILTSADIVVVMNRRQQLDICTHFARDPADVVVLGDLDPVGIDTRGIRDPEGQVPAIFATAYDRIERCVSELIQAVSSRHGPVTARSPR